MLNNNFIPFLLSKEECYPSNYFKNSIKINYNKILDFYYQYIYQAKRRFLKDNNNNKIKPILKWNLNENYLRKLVIKSKGNK